MNLAPGAYAAQKLDIMSVKRDLIGAEVFAAVTPGSNKKLEKDLRKLASRDEKHRYVMFIAPTHPETKRQPGLERDFAAGVEVWALASGISCVECD